jgi:hypothetical protein
MGHSIKIGKLTIMRGNNKLGKVFNVSLPPRRTCDPNLPCYKAGCYGVRLYNLRKGCRDAWEANWELAMTERVVYMESICEVVGSRKPAMFRWHVAGDIPDQPYLWQIANIAARTPDTKHLVFTKKYELLDNFVGFRIPRPKNMSIVASAWPGLAMPGVVQNHFPVAWMKDPRNIDTRIPKSAVHCDGGCSTCGLCWKIKPGKSVYFDRH